MSMTLPLSASSQAKNHVSIVFILFHHSFMLFLLLIVLPPLLFSCVTLQDLAFTLTYHLSNLIIFPSPIILILQDFLSMSSSACCHLHHLVSFLFPVYQGTSWSLWLPLVRTAGGFTLLTWKSASRSAMLHFSTILTSWSFTLFDLYMGFVPHARAFRRSARTSLEHLTPFPATKPCKNNVFP